jgi:hypothetical protein
MVWAYFLDVKRRLQWQLDTTRVENQPPPGGRTGIGWESHCDHWDWRVQ